MKTYEVNNDKQVIGMLYKGRIDLAFTGKIIGKYIINTEIPEASEILEWLEPSLKVEMNYLVISKKAKDYQRKLEDINRGLE